MEVISGSKGRNAIVNEGWMVVVGSKVSPYQDRRSPSAEVSRTQFHAYNKAENLLWLSFIKYNGRCDN